MSADKQRASIFCVKSQFHQETVANGIKPSHRVWFRVPGEEVANANQLHLKLRILMKKPLCLHLVEYINRFSDSPTGRVLLTAGAVR